ncbi:hypothetical protein BJ508DRAFT_315253 [Ascobolus immersus RN42]|uniref:Uncharacterized protein n=1 Tax=Ascobolus immersus RN42 TaxID=1160509 RepID=A0A3N4HHS5_ASCIM|nr:hypothetical protein BJ508DRAFT_315253 [Ascobolus immersus RN42]
MFKVDDTSSFGDIISTIDDWEDEVHQDASLIHDIPNESSESAANLSSTSSTFDGRFTPDSDLFDDDSTSQHWHEDGEDSSDESENGWEPTATEGYKAREEVSPDFEASTASSETKWNTKLISKEQMRISEGDYDWWGGNCIFTSDGHKVLPRDLVRAITGLSWLDWFLACERDFTVKELLDRIVPLWQEYSNMDYDKHFSLEHWDGDRVQTVRHSYRPTPDAHPDFDLQCKETWPPLPRCLEQLCDLNGEDKQIWANSFIWSLVHERLAKLVKETEELASHGGTLELHCCSFSHKCTCDSLGCKPIPLKYWKESSSVSKLAAELKKAADALCKGLNGEHVVEEDKESLPEPSSPPRWDVWPEDIEKPTCDGWDERPTKAVVKEVEPKQGSAMKKYRKFKKRKNQKNKAKGSAKTNADKTGSPTLASAETASTGFGSNEVVPTEEHAGESQPIDVWPAQEEPGWREMLLLGVISIFLFVMVRWCIQRQNTMRDEYITREQEKWAELLKAVGEGEARRNSKGLFLAFEEFFNHVRD